MPCNCDHLIFFIRQRDGWEVRYTIFVPYLQTQWLRQTSHIWDFRRQGQGAPVTQSKHLSHFNEKTNDFVKIARMRFCTLETNFFGTRE